MPNAKPVASTRPRSSDTTKADPSGAPINLKRWFDVSILLLIVSIVSTQTMMLSPLVPDVMLALDATPTQLAVAMGCYALAVALSALLLGPMMERFQRRKTLSLWSLVLALALLGGSIAINWQSLAVAQFMAGIAAGVLLPMTYATAGDLAPPGKAGLIMGKVMMGWSLAMVGGVPLGGLLGDLFGWRGALQVVALIVVIIGCVSLLVSRYRPDQQSRPSAMTRHRPSLTRLAQALAVPSVKPLLVVAFASSAAFYGIYGFMGAYTRELYDVGAGLASLMAIGYGVGFSISAMFSGIIDRFGAPRIIGVAGLLAMGLILLITVTASFGIIPLFIHMIALGLVHQFIPTGYATGLSSADDQ